MSIQNFFEIIYWAGVVVGAVIRVKYTRPCKKNKIIEDRKSTLDMILVTIPGIGMFILPLIYIFTSRLDFADYQIIPAVSLTLGISGGLVHIAAMALLWKSHFDLGRNWSPTLQIREQHSLVTHGSYFYLRHPMYAAHWLWALAQPLLLQNFVVGFSMLVTFIPVYFARVAREETMMLEYFGEAYRRYLNQTGRLFPHWRRQVTG